MISHTHSCDFFFKSQWKPVVHTIGPFVFSLILEFIPQFVRLISFFLATTRLSGWTRIY